MRGKSREGHPDEWIEFAAHLSDRSRRLHGVAVAPRVNNPRRGEGDAPVSPADHDALTIGIPWSRVDREE